MDRLDVHIKWNSDWPMYISSMGIKLLFNKDKNMKNNTNVSWYLGNCFMENIII